MIELLLPCVLLLCAATQTVDRDNAVIDRNGTVMIRADFIEDSDGNGVIHIATDGVTLDFAGRVLRGAAPGTPPEQYAGYGVRITAKNVTIRNLKVSGFRGGIYASRADGLVIEDCDVSDNFRQRLKSTPQAEDLSDWLYPHNNDQNEWLHNYGAGIYVEESDQITVRRSRARQGQNALCGRKVNHSRLYDNDFSFLSGWGIALYRSNQNVISRNNCDFCMRGYSHGVYSRGQDSAGILFFEQCSDNVVAYNSATHSGDGFFGFAGNEVLDGKSEDPHDGCNRNLLIGNDFSYSAANAIEMTFSRDNVFADNVLNAGNYGIWGGYSSDSKAVDNVIEGNLIAGVAVEHGSNWMIADNKFQDNARGVQLWWDEDRDLLAKPWAIANDTASHAYRLLDNSFEGDRIGFELKGGTRDVVLSGNDWKDVPQKFNVDEPSTYDERDIETTVSLPRDERIASLPGEREAVGLRKHLAGREHIIMTEYGPYDWEGPYLHFVGNVGGDDVYRLLGEEDAQTAEVESDASLRVVRESADENAIERTLVVSAGDTAMVAPYRLRVTTQSESFEHSGLLISAKWAVSVFSFETDPREDVAAWRREAETHPVTFQTTTLRLNYRNCGPSDLGDTVPQSVRDAKLPRDHFGTFATTNVRFPRGRWTVRTTSDDGVRVWVDEAQVIDNWTHHAPAVDEAAFTVESAEPTRIRVEHFELDGYAMLAVEFAPANEAE